MNFLSRILILLDIMGKPGKLLSYFDYNVREINIFVQNPIFLLFNSAEPETTAKESQSLENDETCLVGRDTFIFGSIRAESRNCS